MSETKSRRPLVIALASVVACLAIGGLLLWLVPGKSEPKAPSTFELKGKMTLTGTGADEINGKCFGKGGYSDINPGTSVVVYDSTDKVIATGHLDDGSATSAYQAPCTFTFAVKDVPLGEKFYQVQISHRGKIPVQAADATAGNTSLSLG